MRKLLAISTAVVVGLSMTGCPKGGNSCKEPATRQDTVQVGKVVHGKRTLCLRTSVCKDGEWQDYINDESCHKVDA